MNSRCMKWVRGKIWKLSAEVAWHINTDMARFGHDVKFFVYNVISLGENLLFDIWLYWYSQMVQMFFHVSSLLDQKVNADLNQY